MKRPINYKPQYSLSIYYLKMALSRKEFNDLMKRYVAVKVANWKPKLKGK